MLAILLALANIGMALTGFEYYGWINFALFIYGIVETIEKEKKEKPMYAIVIIICTIPIVIDAIGILANLFDL